MWGALGGGVGGTRPGRGERKEWDGKCVNDAVFSLSVQTARRRNRQRGKEHKKVYVVCTAVVWPGVQGWGGWGALFCGLELWAGKEQLLREFDRAFPEGGGRVGLLVLRPAACWVTRLS